MLLSSGYTARLLCITQLHQAFLEYRHLCYDHADTQLDSWCAFPTAHLHASDDVPGAEEHVTTWGGRNKMGKLGL